MFVWYMETSSIRELICEITFKMDAHLVGYGSSSDEEKKDKKQDVQNNPVMKEKNFRKRPLSPDDTKDGSIKSEEQKQPVEMKEDAQKIRSPISPSKLDKQSVEKSPDRKQKNRARRSRSHSRSSSGSTDKEPRSAVDEFGRHVRRRQSDKNKDEDRGRRRHSRDQRRSRSRSRDRDRNRGGAGGAYGRQNRRCDDRRDDRRDDIHDDRRDDRRDDRHDDRHDNKLRDNRRRRYSDRGRERSPERLRDRSPDRSRNRDREPERRFLGGTEKRVPESKEKVTMSSEDIEKKLAARAESLKHVAQANAVNHNLPSYLNPAVVNPQLYAKQQERRKLLWSSKKAEQTPSNTKMWAGTKFAGDQGGEVQAKFRRLMGIKGENATSDDDTAPSGENILTGLEKEFERSRAFQLSRGAGGKSGIGLGYAPAGAYPNN